MPLSLKYSAVKIELEENRGYFSIILSSKRGFPGSASGKELACQRRRLLRLRFDPWAGKIPWKRAWQHTPVFLPGKSHGQRNLGSYSPRGRKRVRHDLATNKDNMTYRYSTIQSMNILSGWQIPATPFQMPYWPNLPAPASSGETGMEGWPCSFKGHNKDIF